MEVVFQCKQQLSLRAIYVDILNVTVILGDISRVLLIIIGMLPELFL